MLYEILNICSHIGSNETDQQWNGQFRPAYHIFFLTGTTYFIHQEIHFFLCKIWKGFKINSSKVWSVQILIIFQQWTLLGSRSQFIVAISLVKRDMDEKAFTVFLENV